MWIMLSHLHQKLLIELNVKVLSCPWLFLRDEFTIDLISDCNVIIFYLNWHLYVDFYWLACLTCLTKHWPIALGCAWPYYLPVSHRTDHTLTCTTCVCISDFLLKESKYFWKKVENCFVVLLVFYHILIISILCNNIRMTRTTERTMYHYTWCI